MNKEIGNKILNELKKFTGTEQYWSLKPFIDMNVTDGVKYLVEKTGCFWFINIIVSVQHLKKIQDNKELLVWSLRVNKNESWEVFCNMDSGKNILYKQKGDCTDFPLNKIDIWQGGKTLCLPSEF